MFATQKIVRNGSLTPFIWVLTILMVFPAFADQANLVDKEEVDKEEISILVGQAMQEFNIPGMAVGIVHRGSTVLSAGYGLRELGHPGPVDSATLFKIASNTKSFTTAALAMLVDEGLISWDGAVIDYIPEFQMSDPWVTAHFTVTDLLTHRSGLRSYVGDQMLWPEPNVFTRADIIHAFRYFEIVDEFRAKYAYDNLLYIVAGEIIPRVTGQSWGEFVDQRIMLAAGMKRCFAGHIPDQEMHNLAVPHGVIEGQLSVIERGRISGLTPVNAAAGGIVCSLVDMLKWVRIQLNRGTTPAGVELFSSAQSQELWKPHTRLGISEIDRKFNKKNFSFYGLGWRLSDIHGYKQVSHTGSVAGFRAFTVLIPELELGVVVLTNGSSAIGRNAVMNHIIRSFMPVEPLDWVQVYKDAVEIKESVGVQRETELAAKAKQLSVTDLEDCCTPDELSLFTGRYQDPWFGAVTIRLEDGHLVFVSDKSPRFIGALQHQAGHHFLLRWTDRTLNGDAWLMFEHGEEGNGQGFSMLAAWVHGDWDWKDLHFTRVKQGGSDASNDR